MLEIEIYANTNEGSYFPLRWDLPKISQDQKLHNPVQ